MLHRNPIRKSRSTPYPDAEAGGEPKPTQVAALRYIGILGWDSEAGLIEM
ncbi:MAG: hypothetical protein QGI90_10980 [Nitrospinaceae bacterium]|nr:hypothetical protein [Nitrospinaceae bacterium]